MDDDKAERWAAGILAALDLDCLHDFQAAKLAGRVTFAVTLAANRVGRAQAKPLFAQANSPYPGGRLSLRLRAALIWWYEYLMLRPPVHHHAGRASRPHLRTWSDAAGASRVLAVFLYDERNGAWLYTAAEIPERIWQQLADRRDHQIGYQEIAAPWLALATWPELLMDCLWTNYMDNQGSMHSLLNGSCTAPEQNIGAGKFWLRLAEANVDFQAYRVESKSNLADGPTRFDLQWVGRLGASFTPPVYPLWAFQVWEMFEGAGV